MTTLYTVRQGDTLSGLAQRNGLDASQLMRANGMNPALADGHVSRQAGDPDRLLPGQRLTIPAATPGYERTHTVGAGDTLSSVAQRWGVGLPELLAANPQFDVAQMGGGMRTARGAPGSWDPDALRVGDVIRRPGAGAPAPTASANPTAPATAPHGPNAPLDLRRFLNPDSGSQALAAIVIGSAEGTRTPQGGTTSAWSQHTDPGNNAVNKGSFSYQGQSRSPQEADRKQLAQLSRQIPAYEAAAARAGVPAQDARLASTYFDLYNQSPTAAARLLNQLPALKGQPLTPQRLAQARFDAFVNPASGQRFTNPNGSVAGSGFVHIAQDKLGHTPTEADIQQTIRADQTRRTLAIESALSAQGILRPGATGTATPAQTPAPAAPTAPPAQATPAAAGPTPWLDVARSQLGVREIDGAKNNPQVVAYHQTTSLRAKDDETSWCSSFVNWSLEQAGYKGTGSAGARSWSWEQWGQTVPRTPQAVRPGDIVVFPRGDDPRYGHVAIVENVQPNGKLTVIGGNQSTGENQPDGVTRSAFWLSQAIDVRRPTEAQRRH